MFPIQSTAQLKLWQLDEASPVTQVWDKSTHNKGLFAPDAITFPRELSKEEFKREVERELTGKKTEPWEIIYFKLYKSQIPVNRRSKRLH